MSGKAAESLMMMMMWISFPVPSPVKEIQVSSQESGTKPLTFTFVPSIGRLPTHFEVVDISKFLVTIPEEPKDLSNQKIVNKSEAVSDKLVLKSGAKQDCASTVCTDSTRMAFQSLECNSSKGEMQNDLFKAEFILITDSGDEDEVAAASNSAQQPSNGYSPISAQLLTTSHVSPGTGAGKPPGDVHLPGVPLSLSATDPQKHQQYKIKTSYKAFAAIPTNTLLMEQKMCSPAQLRQQTEELCAVIDQVLQDPLAMANLYKSVPIVTESQLTKPGVIRPVLVKGKSAQQKEEPYQPNPFKKYLEEISDQNIEQTSAVTPCPAKPLTVTLSTGDYVGDIQFET
ncbi:muscular LMNA interacting protein [Turdus rufiventris]|nr:muscular LMNA interacting protein [Turdus rufiventris]